MNFSNIFKKSRDTKSIPLLLPLIVFLFAFLLRLIYITQLKETVFNDCLQVDPEYYHKWANTIIEGDFMGKEIFEMTPLYAYFLAFIYNFFTTDLYWVRFLQALIGSGSALLVYLVSLELLQKRKAALLAGILAGMYGPFIFFDGMIMKPFLALFGILLTAYALIKSEKSGCWPAFFAGLFLAMTALARENVVLLIPVIPLWYLGNFRDIPLTVRMKKGGAFLIGVAVIISPVTLRNYVVGNEFVAITSGGGEVFYMANNLQADGTYKPPDFVRPNPSFEHEDFRKKAEELTGRSLSRKESSDFWFQRGFRYIQENPLHFAKLAGKKFALFWNYYEFPDNRNYYFQQILTPFLGLPLLTFDLLAPLGFLGLLLGFRKMKRMSVAYILFVIYFFSFLIFYNFSRFRIPAVPFIIIFAVYALFWLVDQFQQGKGKKGLVVLACCPILYFLFHIDISVQDPFRSRFDTAYANLGLCYEKAFQDKEALVSYQEALKINPGFPLALAGSGNVFFRQGNVEAAKKAYVAALQNNPDSFIALNGLGNVLLTLNKPEQSLKAYQKALTIVPKNPRYLANAGFALMRMGKHSQALGKYTKAIATDPEYAIAYYGLGMAKEGVGDALGAIQNYTTFIQKGADPNWKARAAEKIKRLQTQ